VYLAHLLGARVLGVTIEPDRDDGPARYGDASILWPARRWSTRDLNLRCVRVALAGPVAEMIHRGEPLHPGFVPEWSQDWRVAWEYAGQLVADERARTRFLEDTTRQLHAMLRQDEHWHRLACIVDHLLAHETLDEEQLAEILEEESEE
jgi:hypothetical protein